MEIKGFLSDTTTFQAVYGAKVYLINIEDSVITAHQNTNENGEFHFKIPLSNYRMFIAHTNYNDKEFVFMGTEENNFFDIGEIIVDDDITTLESIAVYAYRDPIYYKDDTLIYIADSFATKDHEVVEDLLKKLPGITVESDGSIKSQGKEIAKVYVDGDEFFGSDPTIATKNLGAKSIDRVQIYEIEDEDGQIGDEKLQILDLKLKDNAKKGWFAKANAATDFHRFYEGQLLFNRFNKTQKIFAFGLGSNTLNSSISRGDAALAGVGNSVGGKNATNGHPQTFRVGALFSQQITKKFKLEGNYLFSDARIRSFTEKSTQFLLRDTTYFSTAATNRLSTNQSHDLSLNFKIDIDSSQTLQIAPNFNLTTASTKNEQNTLYSDENQLAQRDASSTSSNKSQDFTVGGRVLYTKRFAKPKRNLSISDKISYQQNKGENTLYYYDYFYLLNLTDNEIQQLKDNSTVNFSNTLLAKYVEPLNQRWSLNFDYELMNNSNNQNRYSYNFDGSDYTELDSLTSNEFVTTRLQNKLGIAGVFAHPKHNVTLGLRGRNLIVQNVNQFTNNQIHQNVTSALPFANYRFKISQNSNLKTRITTNSSLPSINYLAPTKDNTNPNNIVEGNENLKPNYVINANVNYMLFKRISEITFSIGANARYTFNDFARSLTYDSIGRSVSVYENINTFNSIGGRTDLSVPVFNRILRINPRFNYTNTNQNNIVDSINNVTNSHNFTPELRLIVTTSFLEFTTGLRLTEQISKNNANSALNIQNSIWNFTNELKVTLLWKMELNVSGNYYNYSNLAQNFNNKFFLFNAAIVQRLGKYNEWELGIEGYDLFNKNTQINRTITANTIVDTKNDIISRYFLFRVSYTFNSTLRIQPKQNEEF